MNLDNKFCEPAPFAPVTASELSQIFPTGFPRFSPSSVTDKNEYPGWRELDTSLWALQVEKLLSQHTLDRDGHLHSDAVVFVSVSPARERRYRFGKCLGKLQCRYTLTYDLSS